MDTEPIPEDCLPPKHVIDRLLRGPQLDAAGRIVSDGPWHGMSPEEVLKERETFNRLLPGKRED